MNNLMIMGRIEKSPIINEKENSVEFTIKVERNYRNKNGEYETDFIPIKIFGSMKQGVLDYCKENDVIAVKGRLSKLRNEKLEIVVEKLSYIARGKDFQNEDI